MATDRSPHRSRGITLVVLGWLAVLVVAPGAVPAQEAPAQAPAIEAGSGAAGSEVLATWKDGRVTRAELDAWRAFLAGASGGDSTGEGGTVDGRAEPTDEEILDLVFRKSLAQAAEAAGLAETPRVRLRQELARRSILGPALRQRVVAGVVVSEDEVEAVRRDHPEAFQRPHKLKLRNLHLRFGDDGPEAAHQEMAEILRALAAGASFEELAQQRSDSQTAARGGFLGFVDASELPKPVAEAVADLAPGELSEPVEHGGGISLFLCEEVREARTPSADEVRAKIRQGLERQRRQAAWDAYRQDLLRAAPPRIDPASPTAVLELPGYRLGPADLEVLVSLLWPVKGAEPGPTQRAGLLEDWAEGVLIARRAAELGLDDEPEPAEALRWREMEILAQAELARRLEGELPTPTEEELRALFETQGERYREPAAYDLAVIDFGAVDEPAGEEPTGEDGAAGGGAAEGGGGAQRLATAKGVAEQLAAGTLELEEAARRYSKDPSATAGGRLGWKTRREIALWGPAASRPIFALRPGETTPLLHLTSGLKIFALVDVREARPLPFEEVENEIRSAWLQRQLPRLEDALRARHLEEVGVVLRPAARPRVVRWATASEFESYGFDVYRGTSPDGPFTRVNEETIPGAGTSDVPHSYAYEDTTADPGTTYYYWVEAISTSGGTRRLTPIRESPARTP